MCVVQNRNVYFVSKDRIYKATVWLLRGVKRWARGFLPVLTTPQPFETGHGEETLKNDGTQVIQNQQNCYSDEVSL